MTDSFTIGYCFSALKGLMNLEVARDPCTSSTLKVKNVDINEFELITSLVNILRTLFYEYGTNYSFFAYSYNTAVKFSKLFIDDGASFTLALE